LLHYSITLEAGVEINLLTASCKTKQGKPNAVLLTLTNSI